MIPRRSIVALRAWAGLLLACFLGLGAISCTTDSSKDSQEIDWNLSDSLKNFSNVVIVILDPEDSTKVMDTVFAGRLADPASLASYKVPDSIGGEFKIRIRGYDDRNLLAFESRIDVADGKPSIPVKTLQDQLPAFQIKPVPPGLLSILDINGGTLSPDFKSDVFAYSAEVPFEVLQMAVHAVTDSQSSMTLGGKALVSGDISDPLNLSVGKTDITIAVKGPDGTVKSYVIAVTRKAGNVARLASLSVSAGTLSPAFNPDTLEYSVTVPAEVETVSVSAASADPLAKMTSGAEALDSILGKVVALAPGGTATVQITVTSRDSSASVTYVVDLKRAFSADAALSSLLVSGSELTPEFNPDTLAYTTTTAQAQVAVLPVARDKGARIKVGAAVVASGSLSPLIGSPAAGSTADIKVAVTAADGTLRTYVVKLQRINPGAGIISIQLKSKQGPVTLDSAWRLDRLSYKATVPRATDTLLVDFVSATFLSVDAQVTFNGVAGTMLGNSSSNNIRTVTIGGPLRLGLNIMRVISEGTVYIFRVTRELSKEANLAQLSVSAGTLKPAFNTSVVAYADTVPNSASSLKVTAAAKDSLAMVIVKLKRWVPIVLQKESAAPADTPILVLPLTTLATDTLKPGVPSKALNLAVGYNLVEVTVVAEDTTLRKTYSIAVERRASATTNLAGLTVNTSSKVALTLNPAFASSTLSYTTSTTAGFVTLTPTAAEAAQSITVNGKAVATGTASQSITLVNGSNSVKVEVTAPDKTSKVTYTLAITKTTIFVPPRTLEP